MVIDHVSILKGQNAKKKTYDKFIDNFTVNVCLNSVPDEHWMKKFRYEWLKSPDSRNRRISFMNDDLKIELEGSDNIQKYIDLTKDIVTSMSSIESRIGYSK